MKKVIISFAAGQTLQLVILFIGMAITYTDNLLFFCAVCGIVATLMMLVGSVLSLLDVPQDIDETAPLPEEIKVSNDKVERKTSEATVAQLFGKRKEEA